MFICEYSSISDRTRSKFKVGTTIFQLKLLAKLVLSFVFKTHRAPKAASSLANKWKQNQDYGPMRKKTGVKPEKSGVNLDLISHERFMNLDSHVPHSYGRRVASKSRLLTDS